MSSFEADPRPCPVGHPFTREIIMDHPYSVWADALDKFHTSSDWIQALWLIVVPVTVLGVTWLFVRGVRETVGLLRDRREPCGRSFHAAHEGLKAAACFPSAVMASPAALIQIFVPADERTTG
jgi:hypothetical protein